ncbi:MAG: hypothetical protein U0521_19650 [Anaerolineae bacterium]
MPSLLKGQLLLAAAYVRPVRPRAEALLGVIGLFDDACAGVVLMWIKGLASVDHQVLRENWSGQGDVIDVIEGLHAKISQNADRLYPEQVWKRLRRQFGEVRRLRRPRLRRGK